MSSLSIPSAHSPRETARFVRELDRRLEVLDRAILIDEWNLQTGRSDQGSERHQLRRARLLSDPRLLEWVRTARAAPHAATTQRRLELLERVVVDTQVEQHPRVIALRSDLQRRIVSFRPRWKGKRVARAVVWEAGRTARSAAERRRAFYAMEPLHRPLEGPLRELIRLRNERARTLGFRDFPSLRLRFEGVSPERLEALFEVALARAPGQVRALRDRVFGSNGASSWHPWDFTFAIEQQVPLPDRAFPLRQMMPTVLAALDRWGFRTRRMRFRTVFHDLTAGGLSLAPDPPTDVRILVHPQGGWRAYDVMFHEAGHAVHSASIRAPRHLLRWHENVPGFGGFAEGIGGLFEGIADNAEWLSSRPGIDRALAARFDAAHRSSALLWQAYHACFIAQELALYRQPDRDPGGVIEPLERRLFGFDEYDRPSWVDSFYFESPVYAANYFLAGLFAAQLRQEIHRRFGETFWPNPRVGPWLAREWFAPGSMHDWVPRIREVTGRPFGARAFRDSVE